MLANVQSAKDDDDTDRHMADGEIVKRLLGYGYTLSGIVEHGNAIGTTLGFPTANIALGSHKQLPAKGVYSVLANVDGVSYHAIANIGTKPTIGGEKLSLEVYMFDFVGDLYGKAAFWRAPSI